MNGARSKAERLLADPAVTTVVVEHQDGASPRLVDTLDVSPAGAGGRGMNYGDEGVLG
jgi:putative resolvase